MLFWYQVFETLCGVFHPLGPASGVAPPDPEHLHVVTWTTRRVASSNFFKSLLCPGSRTGCRPSKSQNPHSAVNLRASLRRARRPGSLDGPPLGPTAPTAAAVYRRCHGHLFISAERLTPQKAEPEADNRGSLLIPDSTHSAYLLMEGSATLLEGQLKGRSCQRSKERPVWPCNRLKPETMRLS